jgi:DNA-binding PadR family transcriptional regulator
MKEDEELLPATYLTILSIVAKGEKYGYRINQVIEEHGVRNWVDIQFSSIYKSLKQLEEMGLIVGQKEEKGQRTSKKYYTITSKGKAVLEKNILHNLSHPPRPKSMFDLGLYSMWFITKEQALKSLQKYQQYLQERNDFLSAQLDIIENLKRYKTEQPNVMIGQQKVSEFSDSEDLLLIHALFERPYFVNKAKMKWVKQLIKKISKNEKFPFRK